MSVSKNEDNTSELIMGTPLPDGRRPVLRQGPGVPEGCYELGTIRPLVEGRQIHGEVVTIECKDNKFLMKPIIDPSGPAKVNSFDYRQNWSNIFGNYTVGQA